MVDAFLFYELFGTLLWVENAPESIGYLVRGDFGVVDIRMVTEVG